MVWREERRWSSIASQPSSRLNPAREYLYLAARPQGAQSLRRQLACPKAEACHRQLLAVKRRSHRPDGLRPPEFKEVEPVPYKNKKARAGQATCRHGRPRSQAPSGSRLAIEPPEKQRSEHHRWADDQQHREEAEISLRRSAARFTTPEIGDASHVQGERGTAAERGADRRPCQTGCRKSHGIFSLEVIRPDGDSTSQAEERNMSARSRTVATLRPGQERIRDPHKRWAPRRSAPPPFGRRRSTGSPCRGTNR